MWSWACILTGVAVSLFCACNSAGKAVNSADLTVCDPSAGPFSIEIDHPYLPLPVGQVATFEGVEEGAAVQLEIEVKTETERVAGVTTRVVEERATENGMLHEVARNFFAQAPDGTVCYFGETVSYYEDGQVVSHEGEWRAGEDGAMPGIIMPAAPVVGLSYDQERAPGVSEDHAEVMAIAKPFDVPAGMFDDTLDTRETSPLDPEVRESKRYARGIGLIVSGPLELVSLRR